MKRMLVILIIALCGAACGAGKTREPPAATLAGSTPVETVSALATAASTAARVITSGGWLIHVRGGVVLASPLDGGAEIRLNAGGVAPTLVQYAGAVRAGDDVWVYLLVPVQRVETPSGGAYYDARVIRTSLSTGASDVVLPDAGALYVADGGAPSVSVSPDGGRIAYTGADGVHVAQPGATIDDFVISTDCTGSERCPQYRSPLWSPDGASLLVTRQLYEGSNLALVHLSDPATVHEFADVSGDQKSWSRDSGRICALPDIFLPDGVWLIDAASFERRRVALAGTRCVFAASGRVALGFERATDGPASAILDADDPTAAQIAIPAPYTTVEAWLPDGGGRDSTGPGGRGVIVSGYAPCVPCGERDPSVAVLLPDGTMRSLPFTAGRVLAVVPPPG